MGEAAEIAAEAESLHARVRRSGAGVDGATVSEVAGTLLLVARLAQVVEALAPAEPLGFAAIPDYSDPLDYTSTEIASPRRVTAGDGIEKGILTVGALRRILDGVHDDIMVTVHCAQDQHRHVDVVERPAPDPSGAFHCDPDGPQMLVLNLGEFFDTRDY